MRWIAGLVIVFILAWAAGQAPAQYAPYPGGLAPTGPMATPIQCTVAGTTSAVTCTLPGAVGKLTYICGWVASATGTTAISPITVNTPLGGTWTIQGVIAGGAPFTQAYAPCVPAGAVNTAITVVTTANASATAVDVVAWGFQL